ncbi:MAG: hypothetical protein PHS49_00615 [Candidatus Gracilibacteria bacterium]|nr:hypothetical protein [Candidatus Gracilibacteria bacterium]
MKENTYLVGIGNYNSKTKVKFQKVIKLNQDDSFLRFLSIAFVTQIELLDTKVLDFSKLDIDDLIIDAYSYGFCGFAMYLNTIKSTKKFGFITIVKNETNINRIEQALFVKEMFRQGTLKRTNSEEYSLLVKSLETINFAENKSLPLNEQIFEEN